MKNKICTFSIFLFLVCMIVQQKVIHAARILFIANIPSYSHQILYRGLCLELNRQGHKIVSVTPNPIKNSSLTNYTEIDLSYFYKGFPEYKTLSFRSFTHASTQVALLGVERFLWNGVHILSHEVFKNSEMKKLYAVNSKEHFDAVIIAQGPTISLNAFAYRFNAPLIGISSLDVYNQLRFTFGSSVLPSHISNWQINTPVESNMSFWRRLVNFYEVWEQIYYWVNEYTPKEDALVKKYLGEDMPHIDDITKNMSIYLVNKHPLFSYGRPEQPNIILYHGFHIAKMPPALPDDLKEFLDNAEEGFIYVSMGTNVEWKDLPNNIFESFVGALSALPYKVLWKYDPDLLPRKFRNILALKWVPQQSILAHPNIKLFIYQGGIQSTEETVYYGVPVVGYPVLWDQIYNMQNIVVRMGVGIHLQKDNLTGESITAAVHEILNDKGYKDRMKHLSGMYKDAPYDSLQNAVRWIEYVIRQNGTSFLRNSLCDVPWYQRYDWDIIGFLTIVAFLVFLISLWSFFRILRFHLLFSPRPTSAKHYYTKSKMQ